MPTLVNRQPIRHQGPPVPVVAAQPNINVQPSYDNCESHDVLRPLFPIAHCNLFIAPTIRRNIVNGPPAAGYSITAALDLTVLIPNYERGVFFYRDQVTARFSVTGTVLQQFNDVVLGPVHPNEHQFVLWCYAECSSCISSQHPQCSPVGFNIYPLRDERHYQGFTLDPSNGTLIGNVTFNIHQRPRRPKAPDQMRRCACESLM
jgi:hypothetical protein